MVRQRHVARDWHLSPSNQPHSREGVVGGATRPRRDESRAVAGETGNAMHVRGVEGVGEGQIRQDGGQMMASPRRGHIRKPYRPLPRRAGIEGTISRGRQRTRLRRTCDIRLARVHLGHILMAVGLNGLRLGEGFLEIARANTRITPFGRLMADAAVA
jgi:hypothetical protein